MITCSSCNHYDSVLGICTDKAVYVNKNNHKQIVCKYQKNAVSFEKVYNRKKKGDKNERK